MEQIEQIMLQKAGKDLKQFKKPFLNRRINARMRALGVQDGSEYAKLLEIDLDEPSRLFKSFSINVTEFYRDLFVWECMSSQIIPKIIQGNKQSIKIWSAGCASGEEPYSLAILLKEALGDRNIEFRIIATDINSEALQVASNGMYNPANLKNLSSNLIEKYFVKLDNGRYQIKEDLKNFVTFEHGDILSFQINDVNLISCRNVLIYYDKPAQELIFKKFHNSLIKDGFLVIGQDETMMGINTTKLFSCMLPRERIYGRGA